MTCSASDEPLGRDALAALADKAGRGSLLVAPSPPGQRCGLIGQALDVLTRRCEVRRLEPLTSEQVRALLGSIFGDVPNLGLLAGEISKITRGNPRECMDVAQHLLDKRVIQYAAGTWTLPAQLSSSDLPSTGAEAIRARVAALSPLARYLGQAKALAYHETLSHEECRSLAAELGDAHGFDAALAELLMMQALVGDVEAYSLANRVWVTAFTADLSTAASQRCHRALAKLYGSKADLAEIHHLFAGGLAEQCLDALLGHFDQWLALRHAPVGGVMNPARLGESHVQALKIAIQLQRPARQAHELRHWMVALSTASDARYYWLGAPAWLARLRKRTRGLAADWRADAQNPDANARLMGALQRAQERFLATVSERDRVYRVDEAIYSLYRPVRRVFAGGGFAHDGQRVVVDVAGLARTVCGCSLQQIEALWQNALAACRMQLSVSVRTGLYALECGPRQSSHTSRTSSTWDSIRSGGIVRLGRDRSLPLGVPSALGWKPRAWTAIPCRGLNAICIRALGRAPRAG